MSDVEGSLQEDGDSLDSEDDLDGCVSERLVLTKGTVAFTVQSR